LESKRGALRDLGEDFVDEKFAELFDEKLRESKEDGALLYISQQINAAILEATGLLPDGTPEPPEPTAADGAPSAANNGPLQGMPGIPGLSAIVGGQDTQSVLKELVTLAAGTKLAQARNPDAKSDNN
jgi:hypothetical protein